ncbi:MAG: polysaccharide lyase beta-sandwich domain-containing protein [Tannerellaceae bacterium]|jgi:chondroitin AC lyase|nr:polysaccharide lyase beta-sandwich domain-containing protein [Tannerellaceae bacterium]
MKQKIFVGLISAVMLSLSLSVSAQGKGSNPDIELLRKKFAAELLQAPVNEAEVRDMMRDIRPDGTWPGIDYADTARTAFRHTIHLSNMIRMSRAYKQKGSPLASDKELKKAIYLALDHWLRHNYICENWWNNEIGTPNDLTSVLYIMDSDLTRDQIEKASAIAGRAHIDAWGARQSGDRIKIAGIQAKNAVFSRNRPLFEMLVKVIESEIRIVPFAQRGLMSDMSFHHRDDKVNNTLSYGLGYAESFVEWAEKLSDTRYRFSEAPIKLLTDYYLDGICKMMVFGKINDPGTANRDISRSRGGGGAGSLMPRRLMNISDYRKEELRQVAEAREGKPSEARLFASFFWQSEHLAVQRADWYASVRMYSSRNANMEEPYNGEGLKNHHRGDGTNYVSLSGREYYSITPVYDWQKIPGTTIVQKEMLPPENQIQKYGLTDYAGAATDGRYGAVGFDFISPHDPLRARKAWFFFDDEYACLGVGISAQAAQTTVTTVDQRASEGAVAIASDSDLHIIRAGERELSSAGWVHHGNVGYIFPEAGKVQVSNGRQTGSWFDINRQTSTSKEQLSADVFKLWIDHGPRVRNGSYAYVVMPAATAEETKQAAASPKLEILSNTPALQAVYHRELGMVQGVFYKHGEINVPGMHIAVHSPAIIVARSTDKAIFISLSDPTRNQDRIVIDLNGQSLTAPLPVGEYAGQSLSLQINK